MSKEVAKDVWEGTVKFAKMVCSICGLPAAAILFLQNCGVCVMGGYRDITKGRGY